MNRIILLIILAVGLTACSSPIEPVAPVPVVSPSPSPEAEPALSPEPEPTPEPSPEPSPVATPIPTPEPSPIPAPPVIPDGWGPLIDTIKYIRVPSVASRGVDPVISLCTDPGTVYMFYHDETVIQYTPKSGKYDTLEAAAQITVDGHNSASPDIPWSFIAVPIPPPPPEPTPPPAPVDPDPTPPKAHAYLLTADHQIFKDYYHEPDDYRAWPEWCNLVRQMCETYSTQNGVTYHTKFGEEP